MKQIWITKAGGPEVLQIKHAPDPSPAAGEVRIRVEALRPAGAAAAGGGRGVGDGRFFSAPQCAVKPPSIGRPTPITKLAAGLHNHSTAAATSSARPRRPTACCSLLSAIASAWPRTNSAPLG